VTTDKQRIKPLPNHNQNDMSFHRTAALFCRRLKGPITLAYECRIKSDRLRLDKEQLSLAAALDTLHSSLVSERIHIPDAYLEDAANHFAHFAYKVPSSFSLISFAGVARAVANINSLIAVGNAPQKGVYIHGSVGVGKSLLMDLFYSVCADGVSIESEGELIAPIKRRRKRCHFHEFMLDVHQRIHAYKLLHPRGNPIPPVAAALAKEARLLCFDEMQITDIADAMIVKQILTIMMDLGVVIVATSNRPPSRLYEGGINRSVFLPFIGTLNERMTIFEMGSTHDYRRDGLTSFDKDELSLPPYLCQSTHSGSSSRRILEQWFAKGQGETRSEVIPVAMGRSVQVSRSNDTCGWFTFAELCHQPLGAADYLAIAGRFNTIIVENIPQLGGNTYNEARRFVILIDALYEFKTSIIIAAEVPRDDLFVGFEATVETHDGDEDIAIESNNPNNKESFLIGEGGSSSSSSTTMIRTENDGAMEWSATGRIGVSLAQLSAVREVSFSFQRAASRLAEMASPRWGRE